MPESCCEVERSGRIRFRGLSLKEFHLFRYNETDYLFNVGTMTPCRISESVARLVEVVASSASTDHLLVEQETMEELKKTGLLAGLDSSAVPITNAAGISQTRNITAKARYAVGNIALFVAQECNMACVYCYGQGGEYANKSMMSAPTAFKSVDWLMTNSDGLDTVNIGFFGGEPLMNFHLIKEVVQYARQEVKKKSKMVTFSLITNGSILSDQHMAFLREEQIIPQVSFDGSPEIQNRQRPFKSGEGSYDKVLINIQKLKAVFPQLQARATLHGNTDPAEMRAGLTQAGFSSFIVKKASSVILDNPSAENVSLPDHAHPDERMVAMEESMGQDLLQAIKTRTLGPEATCSTIGSYVGQLISAKKSYYKCGVGKGLAAISTTGDIYPCHRFVGQEDMKLGNIDNYMRDEINDYHRAVVDNLPECKQCWARYVCGGGCFYDNKATRGDVHLPDRSTCQEVKTMLQIAISLYLQLDDTDKTYFKNVVRPS